MANTLFEFYQQKGQSLPPITERAKLYEQLGIGSASSYVGSYSQNVALLSKIQATPSGTSTPTQTPAKTTTPPYASTSPLTPYLKPEYQNPNLFGTETPIVPKGGTNYTVQSGDNLSAIAKKYGVSIDQITGYKSGNPDLIYPGEVLTIGGAQTSNVPSENNIPTGGEIVSTSGPVRDAATEKTATEEETKAKTIADQTTEITTLTNQERIAALKKSLGLDVEQPTRPNLVSDYEALRSEKGMTGLENQINALNSTIADVQASVTQGLYTEEGQLRPMELIGTRQRELARQGQEVLDTLNRRKQTLVDELTTKTNLVNTIMQLTQTDYANARAEYDTKFSQAIQLQNIISGEDKEIKSDAKANLTLIMNMVKDSGKTFGELDPTLQNEIRKLELKGGMPVGITEYFMSSKPEMEVLAHITGTDANGNDIVTFIYKDPKTGLPGTSIVMPTGGVSGAAVTAAATEADWEQARQFISDNPKASYLDLKSYIQQYTKLNETEINTLLSQSGIIEKETPMSTDTMKSTLASLIISFGSDTAARQIQGRTLTFTDSAGKPQTITISGTQATTMMNLVNTDPTLQDIMKNPDNYKITDKGVYKLRKFWPDQLIYKF